MERRDPNIIDLTTDAADDELEKLAMDIATRYRRLRREVDVTGTLFARHELQCALIEVRRGIRRLTRTTAQELVRAG